MLPHNIENNNHNNTNKAKDIQIPPPPSFTFLGGTGSIGGFM
jgi:hypothetical protein